VKNKNLIIDAKYKYWFENKKDIDFKEDFQQLALYGRVNDIIGEIKNNSTDNAEILFIYPNVNGNEDFSKNWEEIDGFDNMKKLAIKIPFQDII
jgi:5-methylcytosine-specific restriction endonuclease McrBC regulatory subunit McrC